LAINNDEEIPYNPSTNVNTKNKYIEGKIDTTEFNIYIQVDSLALVLFINEIVKVIEIAITTGKIKIAPK
jgi:hypothetical protein